MNGVYERFPIPWVVRSRQHSWCVMDANGLAIACGLTEPLARLIAGAPDAAAEIARLRARVAELEAQRDRWKAIAEKRHAILLDLEWVVDAKDGDGSYCPYCMSMDDEVHVAGCKMAEAIAESARAANGGGE